MPSSRRLFARSTASVVVSSFLSMMAACNPPQVAGPPLPSGDANKATCSATRPQTEPDLMGWDSGSRANLSRLRRNGVVAVRYEAKGCNVELELLSNCIGLGAYEFAPYSANDRKVAHNANELFASLPLGAASLSGKVQGNRALRTDYMLAGTHALPPGTTMSESDLVGKDCSRATHVIASVYVGGFAMTAGESRTLDASASLFGASAGAISKASIESVANEGSEEACLAAQAEHKENDGCAVPLRIGLAPLQRNTQTGSTSDERPKPVSGALGAVPPPPLVTAGVQLDAAPEVLAVYDAALKAERALSSDPSRVVAAWKKLGATPGKNPYKDVAAERARQWSAFALRWQARAEQKSSDDEHLKKLLPLESLGVDQKEKLLRDYVKLHGRRAASVAVEAMQPETDRRLALVTLALPNGSVGNVDARKLYEECEKATSASCLRLGRAYSEKKLLSKDIVPPAKAESISLEHMTAGAELLQMGCDQGDPESCDARAAVKLPSDEVRREEAIKRSSELYLERCEKDAKAAAACQIAVERIKRLERAEQTREVVRRAAVIFEAQCDRGEPEACTKADSLYGELGDATAKTRAGRKRGDLVMAKCRSGKSTYWCDKALKQFRDPSTRDDAAAAEAYALTVADEERLCRSGEPNFCLYAGNTHQLMGEGAKALASYVQVCTGAVRGLEKDTRIDGCKQAELLLASGAPGVLENEKMSKQYRARWCALDPDTCRFEEGVH